MDDMHPATRAMLAHFDYEHLPPHLQQVSKPFHSLAHYLVEPTGLNLSGAEATVALRKLLEAKDCAVRAAVERSKAMQTILDNAAKED